MTVWATRADQVDLRGPNPHDLARSPVEPRVKRVGERAEPNAGLLLVAANVGVDGLSMGNWLATSRGSGSKYMPPLTNHMNISSSSTPFTIVASFRPRRTQGTGPGGRRCGS